MIKYFQNIYVINFSPKFYSLQRKWYLDNIRNVPSKHCYHELNSNSFYKACFCLKAFFFNLKYLFLILVLEQEQIIFATK